MQNMGCYRDKLSRGQKVLIVQKHHQKTGELTEGTIQDILTPASRGGYHPRGIKVRLKTGEVGRVADIPNDTEPDYNPLG